MSNGNGNSSYGLHVAIIMDGNGRWAAARGLPRSAGHRAGRAAVKRAVTAALEHEVNFMTLFTFSTENWKRPPAEVAELMRTIEDFFLLDAPGLASRGVHVSAMGRRDRLPPSLREVIEAAEWKSDAISGPTNRPAGRLHVRFAIDYSGREAILDAARRLQQTTDDSPENFARLVATTQHLGKPAPDVDLLIRTGGEQRLSNCPLWEIAYAELHFTSCLWPDFGAADLDAALQDYYARDRRFGRVSATAV